MLANNRASYGSRNRRGKIYTTTSFAKGGVEVILPDQEKPILFIPTGRGACSPVVSKDKQYLYVCNQFQTTVSEISLKTLKVNREVNVLREPKMRLLQTMESTFS